MKEQVDMLKSVKSEIDVGSDRIGGNDVGGSKYSVQYSTIGSFKVWTR
jgi:hypothetical protein